MAGTCNRNITAKRFKTWSYFIWLTVWLLTGTVPALGQNSQQTDSDIRRVKQLLALGRVELAQKRLAMILRKGPLPEEKVLALSDLLESQGRYREEEELLRQQWAYHKNSRRLGEKLAEFYIQMDRSAEAIPIYKKLIALDPKNPRYWKRLGTLYLWNEKQKEAMLAYEQAVRYDSTDTKALRRLAQLYEWNSRERDAFELQKRLLRLNPNDLKLWKKHGIQARWLGNNREAIVAFKNIIMRDPENTEAYFLLGETYLWENQEDKAEACFREVLKREPANAKAHIYYAQIKQWQPFGWYEAQQHYRKALRLDPNNKEVLHNLALIRKEYGPLIDANFYYIHDSNDLEKKTVTVLHGQYLSARTYLQGKFYSMWLYERKSSGNFWIDGKGTGLYALWHASRRVRFAAAAGFTNYFGINSFFTGKAEWQQTLSDRKGGLGELYSALGVASGPVLDGVLAVKNQTRFHSIYHNFYWQLSPSFHLGTDFRYRWYTDSNEKLLFTVLGEFRFHQGNPSFSAEGLFAYEDSKLYFPDAVPYWTPQEYWTRSLGPLIRYTWRAQWHFMGGLALTQQTDSNLATNWKVQVSYRPSDFLKFHILFQNFGSKYYSYRNLQAEFSYRW